MSLNLIFMIINEEKRSFLILFHLRKKEALINFHHFLQMNDGIYNSKCETFCPDLVDAFLRLIHDIGY